MRDIRIDEITGDLSIYTTWRSKRPHDYKVAVRIENDDEEYSENCPFCAGNEHMSGQSKGEVIRENVWSARSVSNKFPIIDMSTESIFGEHEVLIETNRHNGGYFNMSEREFFDSLSLLRDRIKGMIEVEGIKYVNVFKNSKSGAGASLRHPHSQLVSLNILPPEVKKEMEVAKKYYDDFGKNIYLDIIEREKSLGEREVYDGRYFYVFVPHATRYNGEFRIFQKSDTDFWELGDAEIEELSYIYFNVFRNWGKIEGDIPFNILMHTNQKDFCEGKKYFRTHFHIVPRKYNFGGFELSSNLFVFGQDPAELAGELRFE